MAKKKNQSNDNEKQVNGGRKNKDDGGCVTVVLKIDLHCKGCADKIVKAVRSLDGVESAKTGNIELKKITVIGKVDPVELRQKVEGMIKKKVDLVSPVNDGEKNNQLSGGGGGEQKKQRKQFPVTTTALKVPLHCQGCIDKIQKIVSKTEGFIDMSIDKSNDLVMVKGGIDVDALTEELKGKLKKKVDIVPAKKDGGGGGEKKEKGGGGDGERKENGGGGRGVDVHKMEHFFGQGQYTYPQYVNGPEYVFNYMHATQMFNDENPNACVVM
ncbi:heavy metal-associated isoprenylated plant protein 3 [Lactuca sativa]|uniref:heavy metal-associated isoprenylated plant protein 3 n=1 Tax=Lactuca sativa TaxID=4236 RepID=UPI000CC0B106|nr:heavy metal-associated isoprenylated plant protein 3 [Lactuca sativa]